MLKNFSLIIVLFFASNFLIHAQQSKEIKMLKEKIAQFAPTEIKYDTTLLNDNQKKVVEKLYRASVIIDSIFLKQVFAKNDEIKARLMKSNSKEDSLKLEYFNIMAGPFDRLEHHKAFIDDYEKPNGANFYPEDMTKEEFNDWITNYPNDKESFTSECTVIRRNDRKLIAIPYNDYYKANYSGSQIIK